MSFLQDLLSLKSSLTLTHACMLDRLESILAGWLPSFQPDCRLLPACSRAIDQKLSLIHTKYISVISVNFAITATRSSLRCALRAPRGASRGTQACGGQPRIRHRLQAHRLHEVDDDQAGFSPPRSMWGVHSGLCIGAQTLRLASNPTESRDRGAVSYDPAHLARSPPGSVA